MSPLKEWIEAVDALRNNHEKEKTNNTSVCTNFCTKFHVSMRKNQLACPNFMK